EASCCSAELPPHRTRTRPSWLTCQLCCVVAADRLRASTAVAHNATMAPSAASVCEPKSRTSGMAVATLDVSSRAEKRRRSRHAERETAIQLTERSDTPEDERAVRTTKTEGVLQCDIDLQVTRGVGAVIKVALGILVEDVDGG